MYVPVLLNTGELTTVYSQDAFKQVILSHFIDPDCNCLASKPVMTLLNKYDYKRLLEQNFTPTQISRKKMLFIQTRVVQQANLLVKQVYNKIVKKNMKRVQRRRQGVTLPKSGAEHQRHPVPRFTAVPCKSCKLIPRKLPCLANWLVPSPATKPSQDEESWSEMWRVRELR